MNIEKINVDKKQLSLITLKNDKVELTVINVGAAIFSLKTKDRNGKFEDIVLQYQDINEYVNNPSFFGATVGRVAGRIKDGAISIDGNEHILDKNYIEEHTLHGGSNGLTKQFFDYKQITDNKVKFNCFQPTSKDGFPGDLSIDVTYELIGNAVIISYDATSSQDTILNITNHCHYNLSGNYKAKILDHNLAIPATEFVDVDADLVPVSIEKLPAEMDFNKKTRIGNQLTKKSSFFRKGGIDHCYIVDGVASLEDPKSGRQLKVSSSYPAMQIYTCNFSRGHTLANGAVLQQYDAICFEPQFVGAFDGVYDNHPMRLNKDDKYNHFIKLEF